MIPPQLIRRRAVPANRPGGRRACLYGSSSTRPATLATVATSSEGSTGLETWTRKPARSARVRSSDRAKAVSAIGGHPAAAFRPEPAQASEQLVAVGLGHADVADEHVRAFPFDQVERLVGAAGRDHLRPARLQHAPDQVARVGLVVHHQHLQPGELRREQGGAAGNGRPGDAGGRPGRSDAPPSGADGRSPSCPGLRRRSSPRRCRRAARRGS